MPDPQPTCRVCGCALEGREVYERICAACHEDEVLGRPPKPMASKPRKKAPPPKPAAPPVDMEADTREIVPLEDSAANSEAAAGNDLVIPMDADTPAHGVEPLEAEAVFDNDTPGPELLSLISSSPAMEIPRDAIPDLPLADEPELPLDDDLDDDDDEEEAPAFHALSTPAPSIPAPGPTSEPDFDIQLDDDAAPPARLPDTSPEVPKASPAVRHDGNEEDLGVVLRVAPQAARERREPADTERVDEDEPIRLAPTERAHANPAVDRLASRLNVLEDRMERLERRLLGSGSSIAGGLRAALGFTIGLVVVLAVLAGLTAIVGLTVYPPALDFLRRLAASITGG